MARRRYGRRRRGGFKVPILTLAIIGGQAAVANAGGGDIGQKLARFGSYYVGFDAGSQTFDVNALKIGWLPWVGLAGFKMLKRATGIGRMPKFIPVSLS